MLHSSIRLYVSPDSFSLEPETLSTGILHESLVINRENAEFSLNAPPNATIRQEEVLLIYGIIGVIRLNAGEHLIVITKRDKIGTLNGNDDVYRVSETKIIPIPRSRLHLSDRQVSDDDKYLALLEDMLSRRFFYFSYTFDLSNSIQRQANIKAAAGSNGEKDPLWKNADDRFFWNKSMQEKLMDITTHTQDQNLSRFILPIICGFVEINTSVLKNNNLTFAIITRRSRLRAGTRFNMRGIDEAGNVANFVETEQIIHAPAQNATVSYLQTRGSIPLFWRQIPNIKYTPKLVVDANPSTADAFRKHFNEQIHRYGNQVVVNLINKKGYEKKLGDEFLKHVSNLNDTRLRYIHFDFHHHCKNMRWDRISLLVDEIGGDLHTQGYCQVDEAGNLIRQQSSVVRTNCMDCLDRTNVVQSVLARICLTMQLRDLGILGIHEKVEDTGEFEKMFKNVWADNADAVSNQYSGTGALKTDFTRTGKRSKVGLVNDFMNSVTRYVLNNFMDGTRQDSFDLFVGRYQVNSSARSPYLEDNTNALLLFGACHAGIVFSAMTMVYMLFSWSFDSIFSRLFYNLLCMLVILFCFRVIISNGTKFVDQPKLVSSRVHYTLPSISRDNKYLYPGDEKYGDLSVVVGKDDDDDKKAI